jgi:hypothetical protein
LFWQDYDQEKATITGRIQASRNRQGWQSVPDCLPLQRKEKSSYSSRASPSGSS